MGRGQCRGRERGSGPISSQLKGQAPSSASQVCSSLGQAILLTPSLESHSEGRGKGQQRPRAWHAVGPAPEGPPGLDVRCPCPRLCLPACRPLWTHNPDPWVFWSVHFTVSTIPTEQWASSPVGRLEMPGQLFPWKRQSFQGRQKLEARDWILPDPRLGRPAAPSLIQLQHEDRFTAPLSWEQRPGRAPVGRGGQRCSRSASTACERQVEVSPRTLTVHLGNRLSDVGL